ncbi:MAG TPA: glycosyltransferase, partial [Desulfobacterales bacterium]|nr:glycosyltransferase [Desulfobacterales bacterium]
NSFVLSSHYETFGIVVIEALACSLPVIATRCGGPESIVTESDGLLVPLKDPETLAKAMIQMRNTTSQFDRKQIRDRCILRFGEENIIRQIEAKYDAVVSRSCYRNEP